MCIANVHIEIDKQQQQQLELADARSWAATDRGKQLGP